MMSDRPVVGRLRWAPAPTFEHALLHFVAGLFDGDLVTPVDPIEGPIYRDTAERLGALLVRGTLRSLCLWGQQRVPIVESGRVRERKIWDTQELQSLTPDFSRASILLVIEAAKGLAMRRLYLDSYWRSRIVERAHAALVDGTLWDRLVAELLTRALAASGQYTKLTRALCELGLASMTVSTQPQVLVRATPDPEFLMQWKWALPWLRDDIAAYWTAAFRCLTSADLIQFQRVYENLESVICAWTSPESQLLPHGALLLSSFYRMLFHQLSSRQQNEQALLELEELTEQLPFRERQVYRDQMASILAPAASIRSLRDSIVATHPVDREEDELLFLALWERESLESAAAAAAELASTLRRVVG